MRKYDNQLEDFFGLHAGGSNPEHRESIRDTLARKLSLRSRIRLLPKVLSKRERYIVVSLILIAFCAIAALPLTAYYHFTKSIPANGGSLTEGIVGEPRLINPLLAPTNDADRDLSSLIYSGLYHYDGQGKLEPDLATSFPEITSDGLNYSVTIRSDARWHDGMPVTADDVIFTVQTAQNQDYGAPLTIRAAWQGVTVERSSDHVVIFHLKNKYAQFPSILTMGIIPQHLWQDVKPINFALSELNTKPIGSGPYKFKSLTKDNLGQVYSYKLVANEQFYRGAPHISELTFRFFGGEDDLIKAFNNNQVDDVGSISGANVSELKFGGRVNLEQLKMPRYFALFFNQTQSKAFADKNVRLALNHATNRVSIINTVLDGKAFLINSPMMGGVLDMNANVQTYDYDYDKAISILSAGGWNPDTEGVRAHGKDNRLEITITTSTWPELATVAQIVKEQWEKAGAKVTVQALPISQLQQVIKDRSYQVLLFGEIMTPDPDPFPLWHSSQREGAGQNLALYNNPTADHLLEEARQTLNPVERAQKYDDFQKILIADIPAVFLYSPNYLYGLSNDVQGFTTTLISMPSDRFTGIEEWYIKTKRTLK